MQRILFICGSYLPEPSANAVCVVRLQECLKDREIESDVICESNEYKGIVQGRYGEIYGITPQKRNSENKKIAFLQKALHAITYPINIQAVAKYEDAIHEMLLLHKYDLIICVLKPINGAVACAKKCENYVIYECDSITNNADNLYGVKQFL